MSPFKSKKNIMRKIYLLPLILLLTTYSYAQVGVGTTAPEAALDLVSTDSGLLLPRVSLTNLSTTAPVTNPQGGALTESTLVYHDGSNAITAGFYYWDGSIWTPFGGADGDWTVSGNDMYNANTGNVGVGTTAPSAKFHVADSGAGGTTTFTDGFEDSTISPFTGGIDTDWLITTTAGEFNSGSVGLKSGSIGNSANSSFEYSVTVAAGSSVTFNYQTSTESCCDELHFYIDGVDQTGAGLISASFTSINYPLTPGGHTLRWSYEKDTTLSSGADEVYVDDISITNVSTPNSVIRIQDGNEQTGYVLTSDANGNGSWQVASGGGGSSTDDQVIDTFSLSGNILSLSIEDDGVAPLTVDLSGLGGGGGSYTFESGLTETSGTVRLGGPLTQDTTIDIGDNDFIINGNSTLGFTGEMTLNGNTRTIFDTEVDEDYINFGSPALVDGDDGNAFTDSGGDPYTLDFVWGAHAGASGGTGIAMGSIEYFVDGLNELLYEGSGIHPLSDETSQFGNTLGASSRRWGAVYATNGVITTSDINMKKNITPLDYGLNEIMSLETITYNWKDNTVGKTVIPERFIKRKIGFSAQQLHEVIPEVVQTHSWTTSDEKGNYKRIKNDKLGVYYSDLIPVTVKAIQEQQGQIKELKETVEELKKQNILLMELLKQK
jgi:hypothetical protein